MRRRRDWNWSDYEPDEWWKPLLALLLFPFVVLILCGVFLDSLLEEALEWIGIR